MVEEFLYISNCGIMALTFPPWINGAVMDEDSPNTSFAEFGIIILASMLPALRSCITKHETVHK
jgi:hypothetical protein